jgi:hypothetical protein
MNSNRVCLYLSIVVGFFGAQLQAHGFGSNTLVKQFGGSWECIGQIYEKPFDKDHWVLGHIFGKTYCSRAFVKTAAERTTNCYFRLGFEKDYFNDDILCTPSQEFYVPSIKKWVPAYKLKVGDVLLSGCKRPKAITHMEFVKKPLTVYALEIDETHNYLVGRHDILTHNAILPVEISLMISMAFGEGAAAGGAAGAWFGPITFTGGVVVGGLIGLTWALTCKKGEPPKQDMKFNVGDIERNFKTAAAGGDPEDPWGRGFGKSKTDCFKNPFDPKCIYKDAPYHHQFSNGRKSKSPKNGQLALDRSISFKETTTARIGISAGEFVVLERTQATPTCLYHGHVREWKDLSDDMQAALKKQKWVNNKGKILI